MTTQTPITKSPARLCKEAEINRNYIFGFMVAGFGCLSYCIGNRWYAQAGLALLLNYVLRNYRYQWFYIFYKTAPRDFRALCGIIKVKIRTVTWERKQMTALKMFTENVAKYPDKVAFYHEDEPWTYQQLDDFSNKIGWCFKKQGFKKNDTVALAMDSRPEYVGIWLGLAKIGVVTALINIQTRSDILVYSLKVASSKAIIFTEDLVPAIAEIQSHPDIKDMQLFQYNTSPSTAPILQNAFSLNSALRDMPTTYHPDIESGKFTDKLLYIYTSGTTGFPKAAIITNARYLYISYALATLSGLTPDDVVYDCLPLYHTAGGILGTGQSVVMTRSVVLRTKFSAKNFWIDCIKYNCTVVVYVGEICRYLLAQPPNESDKRHKVRMMFGNGIRPQIWGSFVRRFGISDIKEFYGSTEGNVNTINFPAKEGAIGFYTRFDVFLKPMPIVRCNETTGEILRNKDGYCVECQPFEAGVILGKVIQKKVILAFSGYADKGATEKKMVRDVFKKGDCYFNSGDILIMDHYGFFYFKDRTGDTFRWRGENVSTCEVESVIGNIVGLKDVIVYGVKVPHTEGRAGMVAIVDPEKALNISDLSDSVNRALPPYARPVFLRILMDTPLTATFKLRKVDLVEEAYDLDKVTDDLYFLDPKLGYVPLSRSLYNNINNGKSWL